MTDRRAFLRDSLLGVLAASLAPRLRAGKPAPPPKSCIVLWMNGGPSHLDTWDPKPGTATGGPFKSLKTRIRGLEISEHLPQLAEQAHLYSVLRGMSTKEGNHQRAFHLLHTGYPPTPTAALPGLGGWISHELGDPGSELPAFVSLGGTSQDAGFLGIEFNPFVLQSPTDPPQNVKPWIRADEGRLQERLSALRALEGDFKQATGDPIVDARAHLYDQALRLMRTPRLKAFDLDEEPQALRDAYGATPFGQGCLLARRLVEQGVRCVEVTLDGWDTHKDNFTRTSKLMQTLDPAMATLLKDLKQRNLLERTLVVWMGEFGRTPRINGDEGRDHHPAAWSTVVAGGGLRGGQIVGQTDAEGAKVVDQPIAVPDFFATLATALGMDPTRSYLAPNGRPISIVDKGAKPLARLLA